MQNPTPEFRQSSIVFEKPSILSEKLETLISSIEFNNFCWNFAHGFYLALSAKGCFRFFKLCLDLDLLAKIRKDLVSTQSQKLGLSINQDVNEIKTRTPFCR